MPGYGGTILVAGHNNTYFNGLKNAQVGQRVEIRTSYGNYVYEITDNNLIKKYREMVSKSMITTPNKEIILAS